MKALPGDFGLTFQTGEVEILKIQVLLLTSLHEHAPYYLGNKELVVERNVSTSVFKIKD